MAWSPRVAREVATLAQAGHEVDFICIRRPGEPVRQRRGRVTTWRLPVPGGDSGGLAHYVFGYAWFFALSAALVTALHLRRRYQVVQVNTLPDALVFAAAAPRALGARVLLDLQEAMPEFFATKFGTGLQHPLVRLIAAVEQWSIRFADEVITPTRQLQETFVGRGAERSKTHVIMDGADESIFRRPPSVHPKANGFVLISHGTMEERYGLDTMIGAVALLRDEIPGLQLLLYGEGSERGRLQALATALGVAHLVRFSEGFVPFEELVGAIATAHVGVVAMKRDAFRDLTLAGKMFDFIAMGVPMAVSRTRSVEETFDAECFESFASGDPADLARALRRLYEDPAHRLELAAHAAAATEPYRWVHQGRRYLAIVARLVQRAG